MNVRNKLIVLLSVIVLTIPACNTLWAPTVNFRVAVIVDSTSDPVSREQAEAILDIANEKLIDLTGFGLQVQEFVEDRSGSSIATIVDHYMKSADPLPNGILVFSVGDNDRAKIHRAYAQHFPAPEGFRNTFVSPYLEDEYVYIAVVHFNYRYAACGYGGTDIIQSPVSTDGECPGGDGQACAEWEGMQVCQVALPVLDGRTRIEMAAGPVIHEFMHSFGEEGSDNHYSSEACQQTMDWEPDHFDLVESEYYNDFCPNVYDVFADSYRP